MNKRNGKVNLAKSTVNSFFNESSEKPGAINEITNGANISSNITKKNKKKLTSKIFLKKLISFNFSNFFPYSTYNRNKG